MNTGKNYNKIVYGSGIHKTFAQFLTLKSWLLHPEMKKSHLKAKRNIIIQYADFLLSIMIDGATLQDYLLFEFYNKRYKERSNYVTGRRLHNFFSKVNNEKKTKYFKDKKQFADIFSKYMGRKLFKLNLDGSNVKEAREWLKGKDVIFSKPSDGVQGRGVTRLEIDNVDQVINYCIHNNLDIMEEAVSQHPKMSELYPDSINTVRFITLIENNEVKILGTSLRIGNGGYIDNGGMYVSLEQISGKIDSIAYTNDGTRYKKHPITNHEFIGFQVPFWQEIIEMCKKAAFEIPDIRCVGWDIAVSRSGPLIIEGNDRWSRFVWQLPKQKGLYHLIKE